jgi:hypothetical protein
MYTHLNALYLDSAGIVLKKNKTRKNEKKRDFYKIKTRKNEKKTRFSGKKMRKNEIIK